MPDAVVPDPGKPVAPLSLAPVRAASSHGGRFALLCHASWEPSGVEALGEPEERPPGEWWATLAAALGKATGARRSIAQSWDRAALEGETGRWRNMD